MQLSGKVVLVTGASRGIGKAIALAFAKEGATVVINYAGNQQAAEDTLAKVKDLGGQGKIYQCDVSDFAASEVMIKEIKEEYGSIDVLVNNAGITKDGLLMRMKESDWDAVMNTNLKGVFNCTKAATKFMMKQKSGVVINISSVVGLMGNAGQTNYAAAKAGIIGFTKAAAKEFASRGIRVNAIAPGFIETEMTDVLPEAVKESMVQTIPLGRMAQAEEVADGVVFLASDKAKYITGQVLNIDGGMVM